MLNLPFIIAFLRAVRHRPVPSDTSIRANVREVGLATLAKVLLLPALSIVPCFLPLESEWGQAALATASNGFVPMLVWLRGGL